MAEQMYKSGTGIKVGDKRYAFPTFASLVRMDGEEEVSVKEKFDALNGGLTAVQETVEKLNDPVAQARVKTHTVTIPADAWQSGSFPVSMSDSIVQTFTYQAYVAVEGMTAESAISVSARTHVTDNVRQIHILDSADGGIYFYANNALNTNTTLIIDEGPGVSVTEYTGQKIGMYTATYLLDNWEDASDAEKANGYNYKQTAALVPDKQDAPQITTESEFLTIGYIKSTGVVETDDLLLEALNVINDGYTETGTNTVTTLVQEKPTAEVPVRWGLLT